MVSAQTVTLYSPILSSLHPGLKDVEEGRLDLRPSVDRERARLSSFRAGGWSTPALAPKAHRSKQTTQGVHRLHRLCSE
jgi:hypothetical protein